MLSLMVFAERMMKFRVALPASPQFTCMVYFVILASPRSIPRRICNFEHSASKETGALHLILLPVAIAVLDRVVILL